MYLVFVPDDATREKIPYRKVRYPVGRLRASSHAQASR